MTNELHPLVDKIYKASCKKLTTGAECVSFPSLETLNAIIVEWLEDIYKQFVQWSFTDQDGPVEHEQLREILHLPDKNSELEEMLAECLRIKEYTNTGLSTITEYAKTALAFLREKGLLKE